METTQVLAVWVHFEGDWSSREKFYGKICKDGRIIIPKFTFRQLEKWSGDQDIVGAVLGVELYPPTMETQDDEDE
jgi:hypothetical protein